MKLQAINILFSVIYLSGCGEEDWETDTEFDEDEQFYSKSAGDWALKRLIRLLPRYYETIGSPMPEDSMHALLVSAKVTPHRLKRIAKRVQKGVAKTILHGKTGAVPFSPYHLTIAFAREVEKYSSAPADSFGSELRKLRAKNIEHAILATAMPAGQSRRESEFNRLYRTMSDFFNEEMPRENSRKQAIEFLERAPFSEFMWDSDNQKVLIRKLRLGVAAGFQSGVPRNLIRQFVELFNTLDSKEATANQEAYTEHVNMIFKLLSENEATLEKLEHY